MFEDRGLQEIVLNRISKFTIQIWERDRDCSKWCPTASGVLCRDDSNFYLVTCAHLFSGDTDWDKVQGLVMSNTFTPLNEELIKAPDTLDDGKCDIAIIKLSKETKEYLIAHDYAFLESNKMVFSSLFWS